jgi:hypothetical protein
MKVKTPPIPAQRTYGSVPRFAPGGTVLCVASGPSLTAEDVDYCRGKVDAAIAVNTSYQLVPWASAIHAADWLWWHWHRGVPSFTGLKFTLERQATRWPGVQLLRKTGKEGLEQKPDGLKTGKNSGYQAIGIAYHAGAKRIVLLGYDMQRGFNGKQHWHDDHPVDRGMNLGVYARMFDSLTGPMQKYGVEVINCTRATALTAFPRADLREVLQ